MHPDIEAYLNGALQGEALKQFEDALARDPALREEVELLRPLLRDLRRANIARRVATAERNHADKRRVRRNLVILLCGLLLGLAGIWWLWKPGQEVAPPSLQSPDNQLQQHSAPTLDTPFQAQADTSSGSQDNGEDKKRQAKNEDKKRLFAAVFKPYKDAALEPGDRGSGDISAFEQFHIFYWEGQYQEALDVFESLQPFEKPVGNTLFIKANCLLALGRADEATALLEKINRDKSSRFGAEVEWYLALSYLSSGQISKTRTILQTLANTPGSARYRDAASLLKELD